MKKNPILGIGILAGGVLLASQMNSTPADETTPKNTLGFTGSDDTTMEDAIIKIIKGNKELQRILKGEAGSPGATGAKGDTGATGTAGESRNLGESLFANGALENDNIAHLVAATGVSLSAEQLNALSCLQIVTGGVYIVTARSIQKAWIDTAKLYKVTYYAKCTVGSTAGVSVRLRCFDKANVVLDKGYGDINSAYDNYTADGTFKKFTSYLGNVGTGAGSQRLFHPNTVKAELSIVSTELNKTVLFNKIQVQEVSLGEAVPYNLHWLPVNQQVQDPTNGDLGYYNGTSIVWYT